MAGAGNQWAAAEEKGRPVVCHSVPWSSSSSGLSFWLCGAARYLHWQCLQTLSHISIDLHSCRMNLARCHFKLESWISYFCIGFSSGLHTLSTTKKPNTTSFVFTCLGFVGFCSSGAEMLHFVSLNVVSQNQLGNNDLYGPALETSTATARWLVPVLWPRLQLIFPRACWKASMWVSLWENMTCELFFFSKWGPHQPMTRIASLYISWRST